MENTGKDKISFEEVDFFKLNMSKNMRRFFFEESPLFYHLGYVYDIYRQVGEDACIEYFKMANKIETTKAYSPLHPESHIHQEMKHQEKMKNAAKIWKDFY